MQLIDTNILLRLFLNDDEAQVETVEKLLMKGFREKKKFFVSDLAVAEIVWVMEKQYLLPPQVIAVYLRSALDDEKFNFENQERLLAGLSFYELHEVDFIDAYQAALVQEKGLEAVVSFDKDFSYLPVKWINPDK
jgi:predicted nucleic-acid-binding protein